MGARGIDRVRIALSRQTISIPWESRQALLERLRRVDSMADLVREFEAVGTSRAVELTSEQKDDLVGVIAAWADEVEGGYSGLPDGVAELWHALVDDLAVTPPPPAARSGAEAHARGRRPLAHASARSRALSSGYPSQRTTSA
jgi:hypothetical protein